MRPPGSVYLAALLSRLPSTCASRAGSASSRTGSRRQRDRQARGGGASISGRGWSRPRARRPAPGRPRSLRSWILPPRDAGDVQQVVDQPDQVLHLPLDDRRASRCDRARRRPLQAHAAAAALRIGASGLRSSWPSMARNSSLRRSASRISWYSRALSMAIAARPAGPRPAAGRSRCTPGVPRSRPEP